MLASITPLGERGRHSIWGVTVTAFLVSATVAGAAAGALVGWLGSLLLGNMPVQVRLAILAGAAIVALVLDVRPRSVPGPRRQVDERWRERYRGWVWGSGYGVQLGFGVTTVVRSAATYLAIVAALLSAGAGAGALILGLFGFTRGIQPLAAWRVRHPDQLLRLHRALD